MTVTTVPVGRVVTNGLGDRGSIPGRVKNYKKNT